MKIRLKNIYSSLALVILAVLGTFSSIVSLKFPTFFMYFLPVLMVFFASLSSAKTGYIRIGYRVPSYFLPWLLFCIFVFFSFNNAFGCIRILCGIYLCLVFTGRTIWIKQAIYIFAAVTGLNVFFTYFFLIFPDYYSHVIDIYGYVPTGTSGGAAGYRAGIANHYSQNGIFISIFFILVTVLLLSKLTCDHEKIRYNKFLFSLLPISFVALLLTGKRGVLLWSLVSIILTYLISSKRKMGKFMKLGVITLLSLGILQVLSQFVPEISYVFERFQNAGDDTASLERFAMWRLAFEQFKAHPFLGNGFWSFRTLYAENLASVWHPNNDRFRYLDAHNVYVQVLCETGIVGLTLYLLAVGLLLFKTIKIVRQMYSFHSVELRFGAMFSLCIQIFYCVYSLTGNCLYDIIFYFYALAAAMTLTLERHLKTMPREKNSQKGESIV